MTISNDLTSVSYYGLVNLFFTCVRFCVCVRKASKKLGFGNEKCLLRVNPRVMDRADWHKMRLLHCYVLTRG